MQYSILRYEEVGDRLFISISGPNTFIDHYFHQDELKDIKGAIEVLVAELEVKEQEFLPTATNSVNKIKDLDKLVIDSNKVAIIKENLLKEQE